MNDSTFLVLVHNASLLLSLALIFDLAVSRIKLGRIKLWQIPMGILIGGIGMALMSTPWVLTPGIIFDTRSVLLGISGLFFGMVPTLIAMAMTAAFRIFQGGAATLTGVSVILATGVIGILWRHYRRKPLVDISVQEIYGFGVVIHIVMLLLMLLLPLPTAVNVLANITLPVLIIYPIGTALLGALLANRLRREQTNERLRESEERLRLAVKSANIGFFDHDMLTNEEHYSPEWKGQIGYAPDELPENYEEWSSRVHPDDLPMVLERLNDCIEGRNSVYEAEYRLRHKDGSYRWILARGSYYFSPEGKPIRLLGCHIDFTHLKEAEEATLAGERRFRSLAESSQDYISLYDHEFRHVYENPAALRIFNRTEADVIGKTHREMGHSEAFSAQWEKAIRHVFETGQSTQQVFEWEAGGKKIILDWRLSPMIDSAGNVNLVLGISRDITAIKQAEIALRESESKYRIVADNTYDWEYWLDREQHFVYCSPSCKQITGYDRQDFIDDASLLQRIIHPDDREIFYEHQCGTIGHEHAQTEFRIFRSDGVMRWIGHICLPLIDEYGHFLGVRASNRDITERKIAEAALQEKTSDLQTAYDATLQGWSTALELRERETAGHSQRVVRMTLDLARRLGIPEEELVHVQRGALLHDIGKMGIPDNILLKPGPLTDDEWVIMRQHPLYAHRLLAGIPYLRPALDIPYCHHERWDGSGYPRGLVGEEIPLTARIFSVVDIWDALSFDRPYRPAWPEEEIIHYLNEQASRLLDPRVVEAFVTMLHECHDEEPPEME